MTVSQCQYIIGSENTEHIVSPSAKQCWWINRTTTSLNSDAEHGCSVTQMLLMEKRHPEQALNLTLTLALYLAEAKGADACFVDCFALGCCLWAELRLENLSARRETEINAQ